MRYLLIADPALTEGRAVLEAALHEYQRIPVGPYALLLDLAQPGVRQPAQMAWETGHLVEEPFLGYWQAAGGVEQLGYPISDALDSARRARAVLRARAAARYRRWRRAAAGRAVAAGGAGADG